MKSARLRFKRVPVNVSYRFPMLPFWLKSFFIALLSQGLLQFGSPLPFSRAATAMADSKLPSLASPTERIEALLRLAGPPTYVHLRDIAPCGFNRGNGSLKVCSTHALNLLKRITLVDGFGESRCPLVWLHTANPDDPTELAVLANQACLLDKQLPLREVKPMYGSMNKNHVQAGLLMQLLGGRFFPGTDVELCPTMGNAAHQGH